MIVPDLAITPLLPAIAQTLSQTCNVVLQAPPGAGKSTAVPLALLGAPWLQGRRLLLLEPRRLAVRSLARRMATLLGEAVGATVGYQMRMERSMGPATRIEIITEGLLTRRLQSDPGLADVGIVIFDEFHERSLHTDLGLSLCREVQSGLRDDLRLLVMSATIDSAGIASALDTQACLAAAGRHFPVEVQYAGEVVNAGEPATVVRVVLRALHEAQGDVLVFLPGVGAIQRVQQLLARTNAASDLALLPLYGELAAEAQDRALRPDPTGKRKIVLATNIAETSLTIEGVRIVVDTGLARRARFEPRSGMSRLETEEISQASADQRAGRAGRLGPGICYRLWTDAEHGRRIRHTPPEILEADLAPLALELACWGTRDPSQLIWLDPPPAAAYAQARELLLTLGAVDAEGRVSQHGRRMASLGVHPRLAHMLLRAQDLDLTELGCRLAAVLSEKDFLRTRDYDRDADLSRRVELLDQQSPAGSDAVDAGALRNAQRTLEHLRMQMRSRRPASPLRVVPSQVGLLSAFAYPDRIAKRRTGSGGRFLMRNGKGAAFGEPQRLGDQSYLAIAQVDAREREARIYLAAALDADDLETCFGDDIKTQDRIAWSRQEQAVVSRRETTLGALTLRETALPDPDPDDLITAMLAGIADDLGLASLPWSSIHREWQARNAFIRRLFANDSAFVDWPDVSDEALGANLAGWLGPWLGGIVRKDHLARVDLSSALHALLDWDQQQSLKDLAPTHITVPSGSHLPIDYRTSGTPTLAVRIQELFGLPSTPCIANGRATLCLHLLAPSGRPVQITQDLAHFWRSSYFAVRKDLRGRYPKHSWPDDPLSAPPTRRTRKTGDRS